MDKANEVSKKNDILEKAENVVLQKVEQYEQSPQSMTDKDCYSLLQLIVTEAKILAIKNNIKNDESVAVHNSERDFSFSEESDPITAEKLLWAFEKDEKTENIAIVPMNGEQIVIHGKKEAEMFCNVLTGYFQ